ncbi:MAG: VOC family protein [Polyangiaceae bacterium]
MRSILAARETIAGRRKSTIASTASPQEELDRYWNARLDGGGKAEVCGWLRDRYGVAWQITPTVLVDMMSSPYTEHGKRAGLALMEMAKLGIAALKAAFEATQ